MFDAADGAVEIGAGVADGAEHLVIGFVRLVEPHADFAAFLFEGFGVLAAADGLGGFLEIEEK